jgi:DNA polymerase-1
LKFDTDPAIALVPENADEARSALQRVLDAGSRGEEVAYDVETTGLDDTDTIRVAQFGTATLAVDLLVEADKGLIEVISWFLAECISRKLVMTAHNAEFDALHLDRLGVVDALELLAITDDTLTLAALVEQPRKHGGRDSSGRMSKDALVHMAEKATGNPLPRKWLGLKTLTDDWLPYSLATNAEAALETEYLRLGLTEKTYWREIPLENPAYLRYAACDVLDTARLHRLLKSTVVQMVGQNVLDRERAMGVFAGRVRKRGFLLNLPRIEQELAEQTTEADIERLKNELRDEFGIENPNAGKQIADAIERETGQRPTKKDKDGEDKDSTAADVLKLMTQSKCVVKVLEYRHISKRQSTYGAGWKKQYADARGYIHPSLNPLGSSTGRMTTAGPSMLNVPDDKRGYLIAEPGHVFVQADLSAVEVRIGGAEAGDRQMHADLVAGADPYSIVAAEAYGEGFTKADRNACKPVLLGRMYGRSANSLARTELVRNPHADVQQLEAEAKRIMSAIDRRWPDLKKAAYREGAITKAGRTRIQLASGRCISLDLVGARDTFNALVQGTGRELLVDAAMRLIERGYASNLWLCIHDEWILQVPEDEAERARKTLEECMTSTYKGVPIITEAQILGTVWRKG